ncbi:MAG: helix-turn-helix transcriptional regulator [Burkholderiales bacterium]
MELLHASPPATETSPFGSVLRHWRTLRGQSQMALGLSAGVSTRHVSYLETGRAQPSREMVLMLAQALDVPLRERNRWLTAARYAPLYRETPLDAPALGPVRDALQMLLSASEPNPTFVVNRRYDILDANQAGRWLTSAFSLDLKAFSAPLNMAELIIDPNGMRPFLENREEVAYKVLSRLRRDLGSAPQLDDVEESLLGRVNEAWHELAQPPSPLDALPLMVGVRLRRGDLALNLFTTIATLGTPLDVTLQELRIETLFAADAPTKTVLSNRSRELQ